MIRTVLTLILCLALVAPASLAWAGGAPRGPQPCGPGGPGTAYWGDAPFPGLCGGVVALPFLVAGSLLGGNTAAPCGPPPAKYARPVKCAPAPPAACGPAPAACGPGYAGSGGMFGGIPCLDICYGLLGQVTYGTGLIY